MNPKISIDNLVRQMVPPHKRQPMRLSVLRVLMGRVKELFREFDRWRGNTRMMIHVNAQVMVLEGYLRVKYREPITIKIITFDDLLLPVGLEAEGDTFMPPLSDDDTTPAEIPIVGEIRDRFGDADFIVYIPLGIDVDLIRAEIETYKQVLIKYKIIQK